MWTENCQKYNLDFEGAEELETQLLTCAGLWRKPESFRKAFDCVDHSKLWQVLKEMGVPEHLIYLLRNLYVGQEATVRTGYGRTDWFKIGKGV